MINKIDNILSDPKKQWSHHFKKFKFISYPSEGVIRIFKGKFPLLKKKIHKKKQKILDLGHGDGRHFGLFNSLGLKCYGLELTKDINSKAKELLLSKNLDIDKKKSVNNIILKEGDSENIPFKDSYFDHILLWNSCYYMSNFKNPDFSKHVKEYARVLKKNAYIIVSIPKKDNFCFEGSKKYKDKYRIMGTSALGKSIDGQIMRFFLSEGEIISAFSKKFKNFIFSDINNHWFGLKYKWHVFIAQKK